MGSHLKFFAGLGGNPSTQDTLGGLGTKIAMFSAGLGAMAPETHKETLQKKTKPIKKIIFEQVVF